VGRCGKKHSGLGEPAGCGISAVVCEGFCLTWGDGLTEIWIGVGDKALKVVEGRGPGALWWGKRTADEGELGSGGTARGKGNSAKPLFPIGTKKSEITSPG